MSTGRYRIQAVSNMTGLSTATLRSWERRYGVPSPARTSSAYRLYGDDDVALLQRMRDLCKGGMSPAEAAEVVRDSFPRSAAPAAEGADDPLVAARDRIIDAARRFDPEGIEAEIRRSMLLGTGSVVFDQVVVPALRAVGQMWHDGELSVAHEHLLSEIVARHAREALNLVQPGPGSPTALLACFADEDHSMPLYIVAFHFARWGYRTVILGARTPPDALAEAVQAMHPDLVALSVSIPPAPERGAELVEGYAVGVGGTPWLVGGAGVNGMRERIEQAGGVVASDDPAALRSEVKRAMNASRKRRRRA